MANLRETRKDYGDVGFGKEFLQAVSIIMVIVVVIIAIIEGLETLGDVYYNEATLPVENAEIERFNAFSLEGRKAIIEWQGLEDFDAETYLRPLREPYRISMWFIDDPGFAMKILLLSFSAVTFVAYALIVVPHMNYYLVDIPRTRLWLLLSLIMFPVGWPFFLVSWIRMHIIEGKGALRERRERRRAVEGSERDSEEGFEEQAPVGEESQTDIVKEAIEVPEEDAGEESLTDEDPTDELPESLEPVVRPVVERQFDDDAEAEYAKFIVMDQATRLEADLKSVSSAIKSAEEQIKSWGEQIRTEQKRLGELKAQEHNLSELKAKRTEEKSAQQAKDDWRIMRRLQGVYKIEFDDESQELLVLVRVCVPYEGDYYDFGDFEISIGTDGCYSCKEIRSGLLPNNEDGGDFYRYDGDNFCFGDDRQEEIENFLNDHQYVEALVLMIDCLHWVNDEDWDEAPKAHHRIDVLADPIISQYYIAGEGD